MVNFSLGEGCELCQWIRNMKRGSRKFHLLGGSTDTLCSSDTGKKSHRSPSHQVTEWRNTSLVWRNSYQLVITQNTLCVGRDKDLHLYRKFSSMTRAMLNLIQAFLWARGGGQGHSSLDEHNLHRARTLVVSSRADSPESHYNFFFHLMQQL